MSFLAPIAGSLVGGLLGNKGAQQQQQQAQQGAAQLSQQQFNDAVGYLNGLKAQKTAATASFGANPYAQAGANLKAPDPSAYTSTQFGQAGTPQFGTNAFQGARSAPTGTPFGGAAGGPPAPPSQIPGGFSGGMPGGMPGGMRHPMPMNRNAFAGAM